MPADPGTGERGPGAVAVSLPADAPTRPPSRRAAHPLLGAPTLVTDGFRYAQAVCFDGVGGMYVSDYHGGRIVKCTRDSDGAVDSCDWATGFDKCSGIAYSGTGWVFIVARQDDKNVLMAVSTERRTPDVPAYTATVCLLPAAGQGLAVQRVGASSWAAYVPHAGAYVPWRSQVHRVDVVQRPDGVFSGTCTVAAARHTGAHSAGLWNMGGGVRLVVGSTSVTGSAFDVYTPPAGAASCALKHLRTTTAFGMRRIGAFFVDTIDLGNGALDLVVVPDYATGCVLAMPIGDSDARQTVRLARGFESPTAVARGAGPGWEGSLFVCEGTPATYSSALRGPANCGVYEMKLEPPTDAPLVRLVPTADGATAANAPE